MYRFHCKDEILNIYFFITFSYNIKDTALANQQRDFPCQYQRYLIIASEYVTLTIIVTIGLTVALATGWFWLLNVIVNQVTPLIIGSSLQLHGFFYIITGINFTSFFIVLFTLPETKVLDK